jgi:hypothetical protein
LVAIVVLWSKKLPIVFTIKNLEKLPTAFT